jgi:MoaA/NifB/PqqE/SkfB family radical SAM enzyme
MRGAAVGATGWLRAKQRALGRAQPLFVHIELTYRCNWRCAFCYNPRRNGLGDLSAQEWEPILDDLRSLGTLLVTLTGGEPLLHPDFFRVARAIRSRSLGLRVFTNGTLITSTIADALAALDPVTVEVSIHGAQAATHECVTGVPGSFEAMLDGFRALKGRGVRLVLKTPLTRLNEQEIETMAEIARSFDVPYSVDPRLVPRESGPDPLPGLKASPAGTMHLFRMLAEKGRRPLMLRSPGGVNCGAGRVTLAIDPTGDVFPCLQWKRAPLGNATRQPLRDLWSTSPARAQVAAFTTAVNDRLIEVGGDAARYPFCPAVALERDGDALAIGLDHRALAAAAVAACER